MLISFVKLLTLSVFLSNKKFPGGDRSLLTILTEYGTSRYDILSGHRMKHAVNEKKFIKIDPKPQLLSFFQFNSPEYFRFQFSLITFTRAMTEIDLNLVLLPSTGYLEKG